MAIGIAIALSRQPEATSLSRQGVSTIRQSELR